MIDAYASLPHYAEHMWPIWQALPEDARGTFWRAGIHREGPGTWLPARAPMDSIGELVMVAAAADTQQLRGRRLVLVEHGAGQTYAGLRSRSYSGSEGWSSSILFICPSELVADRWRARYPAARAVAVGCPRLDALHRAPLPSTPTVAITFHWDNPMVAEARWAFPHYRHGLAELAFALAGEGYELVGHGHPRAWSSLERTWRQLGIRPAPAWADIERARVLIGDNTSALPEFASLGKPVVWLDAPWYRRDVHHGGRFWEWPEGQPRASGPGELLGAVHRALTETPAEAEVRQAMVESIYCATDGRAADRAAAAIVEEL